MKLCIIAEIPTEFTEFFPKDRGGDDKSAPHITVLYVGEINDESIVKIVQLIDDVISKIEPISCEFGNVKSFPAGDHGVPHYVEILADKGLEDLHYALLSKIEDAGIPAPQKYSDYRPHATLQFLPEGKAYMKPHPSGSFKIDNITTSIW